VLLSKAGNAYARMFNDLFGLEAVIVRLFMVYGPGQNDHTKLIPYVTHRYLKGERPRLTSGEYEADWIYVDDAVEGLIGAACVPEAKGGTFELGTGRLTSVRYVTKEIKHILGSQVDPEFGAEPDRRREVVRLRMRKQEGSGWSATTSLSDGLRDCAVGPGRLQQDSRRHHDDQVMLWAGGMRSGERALIKNVAAFFLKCHVGGMSHDTCASAMG
jgi:nucleoside-diphosphate-sugar epimerase